MILFEITGTYKTLLSFLIPKNISFEIKYLSLSKPYFSTNNKQWGLIKMFLTCKPGITGNICNSISKCESGGKGPST